MHDNLIETVEFERPFHYEANRVVLFNQMLKENDFESRATMNWEPAGECEQRKGIEADDQTLVSISKWTFPDQSRIEVHGHSEMGLSILAREPVFDDNGECVDSEYSDGVEFPPEGVSDQDRELFLTMDPDHDYEDQAIH